MLTRGNPSLFSGRLRVCLLSLVIFLGWWMPLFAVVTVPSNARIHASLLGGAAFNIGSDGRFIVDFEQNAAASHWNFTNGPEYPGARGSFAVVSAYGSNGGELRYDFTPPADPTVPFNPTYVMVTASVAPAQAVAATRVRLKLQLSSSAIKGGLRIRDASGQTLQYDLAGSFPLAVASTENWTSAVVDLAKPILHWGGANDGIVHSPINEVSVILDAAGARNQGWLRFDDLEFLGAIAPVTIALSATTLVATTRPIASLAERVGVNLHFTKDDRCLDLIAAAGFHWVRMDASWDGIESVVGQYDFIAFDALVSAATTRGMQVLAILDYGHHTYTGSAMIPPRTAASIQAYAAFCEAMARHYIGRNVTFEIWNEPDLAGFWAPASNAVEYAAVLQAGIAAIKRGDPAARVLTGGLSSTYNLTYAFWDVLEQRGAMTGAGGWGTHLYGADVPEMRWTDILKLRERVARVMPGQDVYCTEWGYSSTSLSPVANGHDPVARKIQATKVVRQLLLAWWANLPLEILYDIRDDGDDPAEKEHNFGLLARDYSEKPAMTAARTLLSLTKNFRIAGLATAPGMPDGVHLLRLDGPQTSRWILWLEEATPDVTLHLSAATLTVRDLFGQPIAVVASGGGSDLLLTVEKGPVYLDLPLP